MRYETVYSDAPVCAPSRFTLITGLHSATAGPADHMRAIAKLPSSVRGMARAPAPRRLLHAQQLEDRLQRRHRPGRDLGRVERAGALAQAACGRAVLRAVHDAHHEESSVFAQRPGRTRPQDVRIPPSRSRRADHAHRPRAVLRPHAQMDGKLAARLSELEEDGLSDDTIVFYSATTAACCRGASGSPTTAGCRVPLIVRIPDKWSRLAPARPGTVIEAPVGFADFPPTVLWLAGVRRAALHAGHGVPSASRTARREHLRLGQRSRMDERYDLRARCATSATSTSATTCRTAPMASMSPSCGSRRATRSGSGATWTPA